MRKSGQILIIVSTIIIAIALFSKITGEDKSIKSGDINENTLSLIKVDRDFYKVSTQKGLGRAFIDFADDSVILLRDKQFPIWGKAELAKHYLNHENEVKPLYWDPVKAEASPDGMLGYTFGKWEYKDVDKNGKSTSEYGDYLTVWKKQKDGSWKYVYDGGGSTPGPLTR